VTRKVNPAEEILDISVDFVPSRLVSSRLVSSRLVSSRLVSSIHQPSRAEPSGRVLFIPRNCAFPKKINRRVYFRRDRRVRLLLGRS